MSAFASSLRPIMGVAPRGALSTRSFSSSPAHSVARMILTGRLVNQPEMTATANGQDVIKYTLASNHGSKSSQKASFFKISNFEQNEHSRQFLLGLPKGTLVYFEGDAAMRQWEDAEGKNRTALSLVQRRIEILRRPYTDEKASEHSGESESA
ncbi:hypothetical protein BDV25DRAFT_157997 [Aspergillus avenaceus]|uniref:SsDNA binding protein n=1 Tax=Aspergillus avenaceus TaxID=36643 RepID=A0A5N6TR23_ASPAV|nr:hypothetical protein BDV25DRAFT_157997 [Aspergillus avenaceus]